MNDYLRNAVKQAGGQEAFVELLKQYDVNVCRQAVSKWLKRGVPPTRVIAVERITGIPRHVLRPDIYPRDAA